MCRYSEETAQFWPLCVFSDVLRSTAGCPYVVCASFLFVSRFSTSRAAADGLVDPLTVQVEQQIPPTDRQMDYALEFEAMIPDGVCKDDVSAIISRIADEDEEAPDPGLSRYAHACGVKFSRFVGAKALLGFMVGQLQGAARAELYAYAVNRQEKGGSFSDPRRLPVYDALRACGAAVAEDPALMKSLEDRDVYDFAGPNRGTKIYKAVSADLKQRGAL